jgi:hypothetical protein
MIKVDWIVPFHPESISRFFYTYPRINVLILLKAIVNFLFETAKSLLLAHPEKQKGAKKFQIVNL